jgi:uncharacterized protein (TIGR00251 family)
MVEFRATSSGVRFAVAVQPRAPVTAVVGEHGDAVKIRVAAPPVAGAANDELVRFLARLLRVRGSAVSVVSGHTGRRKVVEIEGVTPDAARAAVFP